MALFSLNEDGPLFFQPIRSAVWRFCAFVACPFARTARIKPSIAILVICFSVLMAWYYIPKLVVHSDLPFIQAYYVGLGIRPESAWYGRRFFKIVHQHNEFTHAVVEIRQSGLSPYTCYENGREYRRGWCDVEYVSDLWQNDVRKLAQVPISMLNHEDFAYPDTKEFQKPIVD